MTAQLLFDAARAGNLNEFNRLAQSAKLTAAQRVHYARQAPTEAVRDQILAPCTESDTFHAGAVAVCRNDVEGVRAAHGRGLDFQAPQGSSAGFSTVHLAAVLGRTEVLRALIDLGVDVTRKSQTSHIDRGTPLAFAVQAHRDETALLLLENPTVDANDSDCLWSLAEASDAVWQRFVARGLRQEFVSANFALMAPGLSKAGLERLIDWGFPVTHQVLGQFFQTRGVAQRPDGEDLELVRALLARCAPPQSGIVTLPGGDLDVLERAMERLPLDVAIALVEAGVVKRKVRLPSHANERDEKKAWLAAGTPAPLVGEPMPFADFASLIDQDLGPAAIAAQLRRDPRGTPRFGPLQLGSPVSELPTVAPLSWEVEGDGQHLLRSSGESRQHRIEVNSDENGNIVRVEYVLHFNASVGSAAWSVVPRLTELFGKPKKATKQLTSFVIGHVRVSTFTESVRNDPMFRDSLLIELIDERAKNVPRHPRLQKL